MGQSEGTMDHEGLVLWGEMPFLDFPYAGVVLKCQIGLFHSLKTQVTWHSCFGFWSYNVVFWTEKGDSYTHGRHCKTSKVLFSCISFCNGLVLQRPFPRFLHCMGMKP